ncbi:MAG: hypothetical protein MUF42_04610 [Cytophagaceae bacterium]|jgi:hypothetical protein|nr:hypothetical protein [Cytophagaceae bacterium]
MKNLILMSIAGAGLALLLSCSKDAESVLPSTDASAMSFSGYSSEDEGSESETSTDSCQHPGKPKGKHPKPEQIMTDLDTDKDQRISTSEAKGPLVKEFSKVDSNQDGFISLDELKAIKPPKKK